MAEKSLTMKITEKTHQRLKVLAAYEGITLSGLIEQLAEKALMDRNLPDVKVREKPVQGELPIPKTD